MARSYLYFIVNRGSPEISLILAITRSMPSTDDARITSVGSMVPLYSSLYTFMSRGLGNAQQTIG